MLKGEDFYYVDHRVFSADDGRVAQFRGDTIIARSAEKALTEYLYAPQGQLNEDYTCELQTIEVYFAYDTPTGTDRLDKYLHTCRLRL